MRAVTLTFWAKRMKIGRLTFAASVGGSPQTVTLENLELTTEELFAILETIGMYRKPPSQ